MSSPRATIALRAPACAPVPDRKLGFGHLDVLAAIAALSFLAARFAPVLTLFPPCPFRALVGLPCATCGMTRAFVALAHGDVGRALQASPLGTLAAAAAWAFALAAAVRGVLRFRWPAPRAGVARAAAIAAMAALVLNWGFMIATGRPHP